MESNTCFMVAGTKHETGIPNTKISGERLGRWRTLEAIRPFLALPIPMLRLAEFLHKRRGAQSSQHIAVIVFRPTGRPPRFPLIDFWRVRGRIRKQVAIHDNQMEMLPLGVEAKNGNPMSAPVHERAAPDL